MPSKRRVVAEDDDEMELEEEEEEVGEKLFPYLSDVAVSNELNLPTQLSTLSSRKKRELLEYKRSHNEVDWETHLVGLQDENTRKVDAERLAAMLKKQGQDEIAVKPAKAAPKKPAKAAPATTSRRRQVKDEEQEEEEEEEDEEEEEEEDDLFDSDEEREISERNKSKSAKADETLGKRKSAAPAKGSAKKPKSRLDELDDEGSEYEGSDGAEEGDDGEATRSKPRQEEEEDTSEPAELEDYFNITLKRDMLKNSVNEPYFNQAVVGHFVRFLAGTMAKKDASGNVIIDDVTGQPIEVKTIYRLMEIIEVTENEKGRLDRFPSSSAFEPIVSTGKRLRLKYGNAEQEVRMSKLSNSKPEAKELQQYLKENSGVRGFKQLTKNQIVRRRSRMKDLAKNHKYTREDIQEMIKKSNKSGLGSGKVDFTSTTFVEAEKVLQYHLDNSPEDADRIQLEKDLEQLLKSRNKLGDAFKEQSRRQGLINAAKIKENLRKDSHASRKAEQQLIQAHAEGDTGKRVDPFVRRETRPKNLWIAGMKVSQAGGSVEQAIADGAAATLAAAAKNAVNEANLSRDKRASRAIFDSASALTPEYMSAHNVHARVVEKLRSLLGTDQVVDPLQYAAKPKSERYLDKLYKNFPALKEDYPRNSAERERYRATLLEGPGCISLAEYAANEH